jgi:DNA-binding IclR family transcriptional regulator
VRQEALKALAIPFLLAIREKMTETFGLSVLDEKRRKNVIIYSIHGPDYICFSFRDKTATPLHTSAPGKALVAYLPERRRDALIGRLSFERLTPNTITDRPTYEKRLAVIRRVGYATDIAEEIFCCHCGGVAILDPNGTPVGALWLSGVDKRLPAKHLRGQIRHLQAAARHIEAEVAKRFAVERSNSSHSPCVAAALETLSRQRDRDIDYEALARSCRVSYSTLRTLFRRETGTTLGQHHLELRMKDVERLLTQTSLSVSDIAARMGFCDQKHLSASFKKRTGVTPLAFRRQSDTTASSGA